jgi:hypothetical protein
MTTHQAKKTRRPILHTTCCYIGWWTLVPSATPSSDRWNVTRRIDITLSTSGLALQSMRHFAALSRRGLPREAPLPTKHGTSYWRFLSFVPRVALGLPCYCTAQGTPNVLHQRTANIFVVTGEDLSLPVTSISQDACRTFSRNVRTNKSTTLQSCVA